MTVSVGRVEVAAHSLAQRGTAMRCSHESDEAIATLQDFATWAGPTLDTMLEKLETMIEKLQHAKSLVLGCFWNVSFLLGVFQQFAS